MTYRTILSCSHQCFLHTWLAAQKTELFPLRNNNTICCLHHQTLFAWRHIRNQRVDVWVALAAGMQLHPFVRYQCKLRAVTCQIQWLGGLFVQMTCVLLLSCRWFVSSLHQRNQVYLSHIQGLSSDYCRWSLAMHALKHCQGCFQSEWLACSSKCFLCDDVSLSPSPCPQSSLFFCLI